MHPFTRAATAFGGNSTNWWCVVHLVIFYSILFTMLCLSKPLGAKLVGQNRYILAPYLPSAVSSSVDFSKGTIQLPGGEALKIEIGEVVRDNNGGVGIVESVRQYFEVPSGHGPAKEDLLLQGRYAPPPFIDQARPV